MRKGAHEAFSVLSLFLFASTIISIGGPPQLSIAQDVAPSSSADNPANHNINNTQAEQTVSQPSAIEPQEKGQTQSAKAQSKNTIDKVTSEGRQSAHERLQKLKSLQMRESIHQKTGTYHNAAMSFSTSLPEGCQITELGDRSMRAFLPRPESFLSFAATAQPVSAQVDLAWFFQQVIQHLPPSWKVLRQEATMLDGNKAYALEAEELHPSGNTYRERIYVMRNQRIMIFDVSCPMETMKTNNASIKTIWAQLRF